MASPTVFLRGPGWRLPAPFDLRDPLEVRTVEADRPGDLAGLLAWLDEVAASGRPERIAAGFLTYEAGVAIEGSRELFRPPATPLAWFALFDTARRGKTDPPVKPSEAGEFRTPPVDEPETEPLIDLDLAAWSAAVDSIRDGIARGDVYQANLTRRTARELRIPARYLADLLWEENPVPWAICIETGR